MEESLHVGLRSIWKINRLVRFDKMQTLQIERPLPSYVVTDLRFSQ